MYNARKKIKNIKFRETLYDNRLTFKRRNFEAILGRDGWSLFKCPPLLYQFLLKFIH
jgi:hypothetical protein